MRERVLHSRPIPSLILIPCGSINLGQYFVSLNTTGCSGSAVPLSNPVQPLPRLDCCTRPFKAINAMWVYSHSYWLIIFCTINRSRVPVRERRQTLEDSWGRTQHFLSTLYLTILAKYTRSLYLTQLVAPSSFYILTHKFYSSRKAGGTG